MILAELSMNTVGFGVLATLCLLSAVGVVASRSAMWSALRLVATFFLIAILYFTLQSNLLGVTQIAVYAGGIMVLFLFIIAIIQVGKPKPQKVDYKVPIAIAAGIGLVAAIGAQLSNALANDADRIRGPVEAGRAESIGPAIFTTYAYPFEIVSILLLIGIVGSILLAKRRLH